MAYSTMRHLCVEVESSYDGKHSCLAEINLIGEDGKPLPKDAWSVVYVSTEQADEGPAEYLFDENKRQYWHSKWKGVDPDEFPHRVIIDPGISRETDAALAAAMDTARIAFAPSLDLSLVQ